MRGYIPSRATGNSPEALHAQALWDKSFGTESRFNSSPTVKVSRTSRGLSFHVRGIVGSGGSFGLKSYRFKSMSCDVLICREFFDGVTEGDSDVNILKPQFLRQSITSNSAGVVYTYPSDTTQQRLATAPPISVPNYLESQLIAEPYVLNDVIWICSVTAVNAVVTSSPLTYDSVSLMDFNIDSREWAGFSYA